MLLTDLLENYPDVLDGTFLVAVIIRDYMTVTYKTNQSEFFVIATLAWR